jgi:hypothetical protein
MQNLIHSKDIRAVQCAVLIRNLQLSALVSVPNSFMCTGVSGFAGNEILTGRRYGGCAILWRHDIGTQIEIIDMHSRGLCAVKFKFGACKLPSSKVLIYRTKAMFLVSRSYKNN